MFLACVIVSDILFENPFIVSIFYTVQSDIRTFHCEALPIEVVDSTMLTHMKPDDFPHRIERVKDNIFEPSFFAGPKTKVDWVNINDATVLTIHS